MGSVGTECLTARLIKVSHLLIGLAVCTVKRYVCVKHALECVLDVLSSSADTRKVISQTTNVLVQQNMGFLCFDSGLVHFGSQHRSNFLHLLLTQFNLAFFSHQVPDSIYSFDFVHLIKDLSELLLISLRNERH